jgi:ubiquinone/menaquinone biosynthesis C-methylase UbiE
MQTKNEVSSYFDALYSSVSNSAIHELIGKEALGDGYVGQISYAGEDEFCQIAEFSQLFSGQHVLDLCCGMGGTSLWFARQTGAKVTGIDCSSVGIELGKFNSKGADGTLDFVLGDIKYLPFAPCSFNAIVCLDGFGASYTEVLQQCFSILKSGGNLTFLMNMTPQSRSDFETALRSTGFAYTKFCSVGQGNISLMRAWLDSYQKHRHPHIRQVGRRFHRALTGEIAGFLKQFRRGCLQRLFVSAIKDDKAKRLAFLLHQSISPL